MTQKVTNNVPSVQRHLESDDSPTFLYQAVENGLKIFIPNHHYYDIMYKVIYVVISSAFVTLMWSVTTVDTNCQKLKIFYSYKNRFSSLATTASLNQVSEDITHTIRLHTPLEVTGNLNSTENIKLHPKTYVGWDDIERNKQ